MTWIFTGLFLAVFTLLILFKISPLLHFQLSHRFNRNAYYKNEFVIETLEGDMHCKLGDWIAKGVEEEIYPILAPILIKK
jgi:hypothetical protein